MTRQVIMVFFGEAHWNDHSGEHGAHGDFVPHESPRIMLVPLVVLAGLSIIGGALQLPFSSNLHFLDRWLAPVVEESQANIAGTWASDNKYLLLLLAVVIAFVGIGAAVAVYLKRVIKPIEPRVLEQAWYYDAVVSRVVAGPGAAAFNAVDWVDTNLVDGAVNGVATLVRGSAGITRKAQSGFVRTYAAVIGLGAVLLIAWFAWRSIA
jgi:NADH-quinone oxidoreductase subunit L